MYQPLPIIEIFFRWINEILSELNICNDDPPSIENLYYAPRIERMCILILSRIPLWSNVMMAVFKSEKICATSSGLESYFKNIKHLTGDARELFFINRDVFNKY